jgi:hypothetical protein
MKSKAVAATVEANTSDHGINERVAICRHSPATFPVLDDL